MTTRRISRIIGGGVLAMVFSAAGASAGGLPKLGIAKVDVVNANPVISNKFLQAHPTANPPLDNVGTARIGGADRRKVRGGGGGGGDRPRYPGDLSNLGGSVVTTAQHHAIFLTDPGNGCSDDSCWGDPLGFLADLNRSDFIHVLDQYVGAHRDNRYPVGDSYLLDFLAGSGPFSDDLMMALAYLGASVTGESGYNHIWHIFLAPGMDTCFQTPGGPHCYSPDNPATFYFCGYHSSFDAPGVGHVVYSVEPYQNVPGCAVDPGSPNGTLADSTNNVLSHEVFEAFTDPDGTGWWNTTNLSMFGEEIGDECSFVDFTLGNFDPSVVKLNGKKYAVQPEYSNADHACVVAH